MGSDFLFATPTMWSGAARLIDLLGELDDYNYAPSSAMADAIAMRVDWQTVGRDLACAMRTYQVQEDPQQLQLFGEEGDSRRASAQ